MKKIISAILITAVIFSFAACKQNDTEGTTLLPDETTVREEVTTVESLTVEEYEPAHALIVSFSHNDPVELAASYIGEKTESKVHILETVGVYPEDEEELIKRAAEEHRNNVRPALKNAPKGMTEYDIVFLCFPIWDNTMPMAMFTFLEDYDMRDKAVIPVVYGTKDGLDNAVYDMNSLFPSMMIAGGYHFLSDLTTEQAAFDTWLDTVLYG